MVEIAEDVVCEAVLAQRVPQVLCWIQLRAVWWQEHQAHVLGHDQVAGDVPARLVHDHEDELAGVPLCDLGEEHRHRFGIDPRQYQTVHHAVVGTDGAERIDVLSLQPCAHDRSHLTRRPASSWSAQQAEAALVLEHQPHRAALLSLASDLLAYRAAKFF